MKAVYKELSLNVKDIQNAVKFKDDNIIFESDEYVIKTCGFFLNTSDCLKEYSCKNIVELLCKIVEQGKQVPLVLHGSYFIVFFNKRSNLLYIFNDLLSKRSLYYYFDKGTSFF